jgi:glucan biosynthesis protein C
MEIRMAVQHVAPSRYHALDSLRAAMMFLGIYIHAVAAYSPNGGWPFKPPQTTGALDWTMTWVHIFRMPLFYVMAGFFAALLLERYGFKRAAVNRFWRIVVPFVGGCIILFPIVAFLVATVRFGLPLALDFMTSGRFLAYAHPLHLWFLEYLIVLYVLAIAVVGACHLLPQGVRTGFTACFRAIVQSPLAPLPFAAVSYLALVPMKWAGLEDPPSFMPEPRIVAAYAVPFAVGWLLYANADLLEVLRQRAWPYAVVATFVSVAYIALIYSTVDRGWAFHVNRAAHALGLWCLIFGITGLFLRYLSGHSVRRRYLCDSSYFLYIAHFPVIIAFQVLLLGVPLPPLVKMALVLTATIAVLMPTYRYAVRPTALGALLNGRRYPSTLAPMAAAAAE